METKNNTNDQLPKGAQFVFIGISIALSVLVIAVTILMFVSDV
jgi:hypothetical protein